MDYSFQSIWKFHWVERRLLACDRPGCGKYKLVENEE